MAGAWQAPGDGASTRAGPHFDAAGLLTDLQHLASPIDGIVTNLAAWIVGGVVKPGDTILSIVPLSSTTMIEADVLNDIGFVLPDQKVSVKLDAFPFTRYGTVQGEVVDISRDANKDDKLGLIDPVRVRLDTTDIVIDGKGVAITPGMAVNAEIGTGDRRVIEYVLSAVLRHRGEAEGERCDATPKFFSSEAVAP